MSWSGGWQQVRAGTTRRFEGTVAQEFVRRMKELHFFNTITVFGATFLLSALPFVILLSSFANRRIEQGLTQHLGLNARAAHTVDQLFGDPSTSSVSAIVLATLLTAAGTIGVAGVVQEIYERVFGDTPHKRGNLGRLTLWAAGLFGWLALDTQIASSTRRWPGHVVFDGLGVLAVSTVFFWWSIHLLLGRRQPWRPLLLPAVVSALFWIGLESFAALYFSSTINSDSKLYGSIGVVFSLLTWFVAIAAVVTIGALVGEMCQERLAARLEVRRRRGDSGAAAVR